MQTNYNTSPSFSSNLLDHKRQLFGSTGDIFIKQIINLVYFCQLKLKTSSRDLYNSTLVFESAFSLMSGSLLLVGFEQVFSAFLIRLLMWFEVKSPLAYRMNPNLRLDSIFSQTTCKLLLTTAFLHFPAIKSHSPLQSK